VSENPCIKNPLGLSTLGISAIPFAVQENVLQSHSRRWLVTLALTHYAATGITGKVFLNRQTLHTNGAIKVAGIVQAKKWAVNIALEPDIVACVECYLISHGFSSG